QLLKHTCLRESFSVNTTVLIDGLQVAENVPILKLVDVFINHRKEVLRGKYTAELEKREARLHIIEGLIGITSRIDDVIKLIRASDG
ncbi:DNA gyrase subunit A, partial [Klebsiella pneumoniae]|uniref:DNA gyrase subunit A n=1 Tax=Klebsiella pneumoniae TaxID=573 RepID=UPI003854DA47